MEATKRGRTGKPVDARLERRIDELELRYDEQFLLLIAAIHALAQLPIPDGPREEFGFRA